MTVFCNNLNEYFEHYSGNPEGVTGSRTRLPIHLLQQNHLGTCSNINKKLQYQSNILHILLEHLWSAGTRKAAGESMKFKPEFSSAHQWNDQCIFPNSSTQKTLIYKHHTQNELSWKFRPRGERSMHAFKSKSDLLNTTGTFLV